MSKKTRKSRNTAKVTSKSPKPKAVEETVKPKAVKEERHQAKVGVKDAGEIVATALGESVVGHIADISDGDD